MNYIYALDNKLWGWDNVFTAILGKWNKGVIAGKYTGKMGGEVRDLFCRRWLGAWKHGAYEQMAELGPSRTLNPMSGQWTALRSCHQGLRQSERCIPLVSPHTLQTSPSDCVRNVTQQAYEDVPVMKDSQGLAWEMSSPVQGKPWCRVLVMRMG